MERKRIIYLIAGSVLLATAIGIGIYLLTNKPDEEKTEDKKKENPSGGDQEEPTAETSPENNSSTSSIQNGQITPVFNDENELINPLSQLKDRQLYPKREWQGGLGYTHVRSSAEVDTQSAWYDPFSNLLTTIPAGTPIGKVITKTAGIYNAYPYIWYKLKLNKNVGFWGLEDEGYVRADTVTFVPYSK